MHPAVMRGRMTENCLFCVIIQVLRPSEWVPKIVIASVPIFMNLQFL